MANGKELISDELLHEVEEAARAQNRDPSDVVSEALRQYLDERKWQNLVTTAGRRAEAKGITEADVPRLVEEARRERRR